MKIISKLGKLTLWFFKNIFLCAVIVTAVVGQENLFFEWVMPVYMLSFMLSIIIPVHVPGVRLAVISIIPISIFPFSSHLTITTFIPAITELAGLVPWADEGIRQIFLCPSPLLS